MGRQRVDKPQRGRGADRRGRILDSSHTLETSSRRCLSSAGIPDQVCRRSLENNRSKAHIQQCMHVRPALSHGHLAAPSKRQSTRGEGPGLPPKGTRPTKGQSHTTQEGRHRATNRSCTQEYPNGQQHKPDTIPNKARRRQMVRRNGRQGGKPAKGSCQYGMRSTERLAWRMTLLAVHITGGGLAQPPIPQTTARRPCRRQYPSSLANTAAMTAWRQSKTRGIQAQTSKIFARVTCTPNRHIYNSGRERYSLH